MYVFLRWISGIPFTEAQALRREQAHVDRRLIAYCEQLRDADLGRIVTIARDTPQRNSTCIVVEKTH